MGKLTLILLKELIKTESEKHFKRLNKKVMKKLADFEKKIEEIEALQLDQDGDVDQKEAEIAILNDKIEKLEAEIAAGGMTGAEEEQLFARLDKVKAEAARLAGRVVASAQEEEPAEEEETPVDEEESEDEDPAVDEEETEEETEEDPATGSFEGDEAK